MQLGVYKGVTYQLVPPSLLFSPQDFPPAQLPVLAAMAMSDPVRGSGMDDGGVHLASCRRNR